MKNYISLIIIAFVFSACNLRSLNPFFTDDTVVFDEDLLGTWESLEEGQKWNFSLFKEDSVITEGEKTDTVALLLEYDDGKDSYQFLAVEFALANQHFMNLFPIIEDKDQGLWISHFVPTHGLLKMTKVNDQLTFSFPNYDVAKDLMRKHSVAYREVGLVEDELLVTDSSEKLQDLVQRLNKKKGGFEEELVLTRR